MKKNIIFMVAGFFICTAFTVLLTDYRDVYIGHYFCNRKITTFSLGGPIYTNDTLTINVIKDVTDSIIQITTKKENTYKFKLKNNILYAYPHGGSSSGKFLANDSIYIYIASGRGSVIYKGKKK
jgi:hypothetical protein